MNFIVRTFILSLILLLVGTDQSHSAFYSTVFSQDLSVSGTVKQEDDDRNKVVRIYYDSTENLIQLYTRFDIWEEAIWAQPYVTTVLSTNEIFLLREEGYRIEIDESRANLFTRQIVQPAFHAASATIPNFACYRTVEETYDNLAQLATENSLLAQWIDVGDSYDKITPEGPEGYDLNVLKLTNQAIAGPKPILMILAAIHAREYATAEFVTRFAEHLVAHYGHDPDITWVLDYFEVHILPQGNPDGRKIAESGINWRKNRNPANGCETDTYGVDLNRNSSFRWAQGAEGSNTSDDPCASTYRGPAAASEPEVQAIQNYIATLYPDRRGPLLTDAAPTDTSGLFLSIHSFAELILPVWAWTIDPSPNRQELMTLGRKFGFFNGYRVCDDCFGSADGTTDDWAYGELGVASYTFELGREFFEQCTVFEDEIYPSNLPALLYATKATRRPYESPSGPDIIEFRVANQSVVTTTQIIAGQPLTLSVQIDDTRFNDNKSTNPEPQNIQAARYTINAPSWISTTTASYFSATMTATVTSITTTIDTADLALGRHTLFVEGQDSDGHWGVPSALFLDVMADPTAIMAGDVNCDGRADSIDALFILQMDVGRRGMAQECSTNPTMAESTVYLPACDISGDGLCGAVDALFLLQCDVGVSNLFCLSE